MFFITCKKLQWQRINFVFLNKQLVLVTSRIIEVEINAYRNLDYSGYHKKTNLIIVFIIDQTKKKNGNHVFASSLTQTTQNARTWHGYLLLLVTTSVLKHVYGCSLVLTARWLQRRRFRWLTVRSQQSENRSWAQCIIFKDPWKSRTELALIS